MYEENLKPLPKGDATQVFGECLATIPQQIERLLRAPLTAKSVVQWAHPELRPVISQICRRLLLPGSGILGLEQLRVLNQHAAAGKACLICLNHRSNLDVPTFYTVLKDRYGAELFERIIWISGRKLDEDPGLTPLLVRSFNRLVVTPKSWLDEHVDPDQRHRGRQLNFAAHRAMRKLRGEGWIFGLFPAGTRTRPGDAATAQPLEEIDSYLKYFDYVMPGYIDGCTLPVAKDHDFTHETPRCDRVRFILGSVTQTQDLRSAAVARYPWLSQRAATARLIKARIDALGDGQRSTTTCDTDHEPGGVAQIGE